MSIRKATIITPCFNAERYICETVQSVFNQTVVRNGALELEYIVIDGGSKDRTIELLRSFDDPRIRIITEPDEGMYDALSKGLALATGDFVSYLNAGDILFDSALDVVQEVFGASDVMWLTGIKVMMNEKSQVTYAYVPFRYKQAFIIHGLYGRSLPFIQQEGTFWRRELTDTVDLSALRQFKLAGDSFLWHCFASAGYRLHVVTSLLGAFRRHEGQLSEDGESYFQEMRRYASPSVGTKILAQLELFLWLLPQLVKGAFSKAYCYSYDPATEKWVEGIRTRL